MQRNLPKHLIYVLAIIIPFWLLFFNSPFWHNAKMAVMSVGTTSVAIVRWPVDEAYRIITYRKTWNDYKELTREVNALKSRVVGLDEVAAENRRFASLLGFKNRSMFSSEAALVVARDPSAWNSSLMIDKGSRDAIKPGMPVVNALGVVGKVAEVAETKSKVILMTDPGFSVAVVNQRSRESGLLSGSLSGKCRLYYLPEDADIQVGDELVTSSISTAFPAGLIVGTVTDVYPGSEGESPRAIVKPAVEVAKVEEVLVIK
jgi:rod shape-determining protein MreC